MKDAPQVETPGEERQAADPAWFREPTVRERWIAAGLFGGFGIFFALLFVVLAGWWFRWAILAAGVVSTMVGMQHAGQAFRRNRQ